MMQGTISIDSEVGKGSTFTVLLPAEVIVNRDETARPPVSADISATAQTVRTSRDTILVIDDDPAVRDLTSRSLMKMGFNVITGESGAEGLELAKEAHPILITLDVMMPEMDGWTVLKRLKADPSLAKIPVIMVTIVDNEPMG